MRSIRYIYFALMGFILILGILIIVANMRSHSLTKDIIKINELRQEQYSILTNLKSSEDLLSKFSRNYTVTSNQKWRLLYNQVKGIRDGYLPFPEGFNFDYWAHKSDPSFNVKEIVIPVRPEYPSFLSRLRDAGSTESQLAFLSQAISRSEDLNETQEAAMDLVQGIKRTARSIEEMIPQPKLAQELLFSSEYTHENTRIMSAIGAFFDVTNTTTNQERNRLRSERTNIINFIFSMAFLLIITVTMTTALLWFRLLKPLENIRRSIVNKVRDRQFEFNLDVENQGELKDLAEAQNAVLGEIGEQFESNRQIKAFSDLIRGCVDTKDLGEQVANFFSQRFDLPFVAIYVLRGEELKLAGGVGVDEQIESMKASTVSFYRTIMRTKEFLRIQNEEDKFNLQLPAGTLQLKEIYFIPLKIKNDIVGILELGSVRLLSDKEIAWLSLAQEDLVVGIQLTNNAELQQIAERRISEQLKLNQQIINAIPNPTYFRNTQGKYIGVNDAFTDFLGLFYVDVVDKSPDELFSEDVALMFTGKEKALLENPGSNVYDIELNDSQGEIRILTVYEATYFGGDGHPQGIVGLFVDVTMQKKLESDLISAKDQATEASKAKGEFLANMSHEIRTPMNAILGMSHLALLTNLNDKQRNYVSNIEKAGTSLLGIINDILDFSKIEAGKFTIENIDFRFTDVLDNISNIVSVKAQTKNLELIFDIDPDLPDNLVGDPLRLGQIIINLTGNSVKFTENGEIIIRARKISEENDIIEIQFDIEDSGIGMNDEQMSRLFQSFSQADGSITRKYGGTGLGLTISKNFVELMNGRIWVESELGKGSTFSFTIHCGRSETCIKETIAKTTVLIDKRVLVVDDNQASRDIMYALLDNLNLRVSAVSNGEEAIEEVNNADKSNDAFDVIVMDWKMPGINGDEATRKIHGLDLQKQPKVILASAYGEDSGLVIDDEEKLFDSSLVKPINPSSLFDALMGAFGKEELKHRSVKSNVAYTSENTDFTGLRILLVEDNMINQEVAKGILEQFNPEIEVADNGQIALDMLQKSKFDIVLMDMQMPVMDGVTATKKIREIEQFAHLPVLAMTANAMDRDVQVCKDAGMNGHLSKPIDIKDLVESISYWTSLTKQEMASSNVQSAHTDTFIFDSEEGIARIGGKYEAFWKVITAFTKTKLGLIDEMKKAIEDEDREKIAHFAHSLRGAAANVSAKSLASLAGILEGQADTQLPMQSALLDKIKDTLTQIQTYIPGNEPANTSAEDSNVFKGYTPREFRIELEQLEILLCNFDTQAVDFIAGIKENAKNMALDLSDVDEAIHKFEYEIATKKLRILIDTLGLEEEETDPTIF